MKGNFFFHFIEMELFGFEIFYYIHKKKKKVKNAEHSRCEIPSHLKTL